MRLFDVLSYRSRHELAWKGLAYRRQFKKLTQD